MKSDSQGQVSTLLDSNFDGPIILQSFEAESLRKLKQLQPQWQRIKLCIDARAALQGSVDPSEALPDVPFCQSFLYNVLSQGLNLIAF